MDVMWAEEERVWETAWPFDVAAVTNQGIISSLFFILPM